jgi:hypothetical protein
MDLTSILVACCLAVIILTSGTRIIRTPSRATEAALRALRQSHRRAQQKNSELVTRVEVARSAWTALFTDPDRGKPVSVMLEVKLVDQIQARADAVLKELQPISQGSPRMKPAELRKLHARVWKQIPVLNVCLWDIEESLSRLRWLTSHMGDPSMTAEEAEIRSQRVA